MPRYKVIVTTYFRAESDKQATKIATDQLWDGPTEVEVVRIVKDPSQ